MSTQPRRSPLARPGTLQLISVPGKDGTPQTRLLHHPSDTALARWLCGDRPPDVVDAINPKDP